MRKSLSARVRSVPNLEDAWRVIHRNGRASQSVEVRKEIETFSQDAPKYLRSISWQLARKKFKFEKAKGVPLPKLDSAGRPTGSIRPIVLAPVRSRIVQRAILNVLSEAKELQPYFTNPTSFGGVRKPRSPEAWLESGVAGAVAAALRAIEAGATHVAAADITAFFTGISKPEIRSTLSGAISDPDFVRLFDDAINVELENLDQLRQHKASFPIEEIGVAQGSSLSPLLGNVYLSGFDATMNSDGCTCLRYIDDFLLLGPSEAIVNTKLSEARALLKTLGLELSGSKSHEKAASLDKGFDFLGIEFCPGIIRPGKKARRRLLAALNSDADESLRQMRQYEKTGSFDRQKSVIHTLKRLEGRAYAWRKQYWFCNDRDCFDTLNRDVSSIVGKYLGRYRTVRDTLDANGQRAILGIPDLRRSDRSPLTYPKTKRVSTTAK